MLLSKRVSLLTRVFVFFVTKRVDILLLFFLCFYCELGVLLGRVANVGSSAVVCSGVRVIPSRAKTGMFTRGPIARPGFLLQIWVYGKVALKVSILLVKMDRSMNKCFSRNYVLRTRRPETIL